MNIDRAAELQRWQDSGAVWEVISRKGGGVTVALLRCDGGEEVDRIVTDERPLTHFLAGRSSSEE